MFSNMPLKRMRLADVAAIAVAIPPPLVSIEPETQHPVYLQQWEFMEEADRRLAIEHSDQYADTAPDQPTADTLEDALVDEDESGGIGGHFGGLVDGRGREGR